MGEVHCLYDVVRLLEKRKDKAEKNIVLCQYKGWNCEDVKAKKQAYEYALELLKELKEVRTDIWL